jgi:hypothetical protein
VTAEIIPAEQLKSGDVYEVAARNNIADAQLRQIEIVLLSRTQKGAQKFLCGQLSDGRLHWMKYDETTKIKKIIK